VTGAGGTGAGDNGGGVATRVGSSPRSSIIYQHVPVDLGVDPAPPSTLPFLYEGSF